MSLFKKGKSDLSNYKAHSIVSRQSSVHGDIVFTGGLHIEGKVQGNVRSQEGCVVVHGEMVGDLVVPNAIINGTVKGNIICSQHLELSGAARVMGVVSYSQMEMHLGAQVTGELRPLSKDAVEVKSEHVESVAEKPVLVPEKKELRAVP